jgi:hypothetical protein
MASSKWPSALSVIQDACAILALPVPTAAASAQDDDTAQQMLALLTWSGRRLVKPTSTIRWTALTKTWTLTTVPGKTLYDLPDDWDSFFDLTAWNTATRLPMIGPASGPAWAQLRARSLGPSTISIVYRTRGNQFEIYTSPSVAQTLTVDYTSRTWVQDNVAAPPVWRDKVLLDSDSIVYDNELITAKLKLAWLTAKGFDTTAAQAEYNEIEEQAINADTDAPVLCADDNGWGEPMLSGANVPDTGYGG